VIFAHAPDLILPTTGGIRPGAGSAWWSPQPRRRWPDDATFARQPGRLRQFRVSP